MGKSRVQDITEKDTASLQLAETATLTVVAVLLPYLIHFIPSWDDSPIGGKLLPIFYAPLIAALLYRMHVAVIISFVSPWINHLLTGMPSTPVAIQLTVQLAGFSVFVFYIAQWGKHRWWLGPGGYLVSKPLVFVVLLLMPQSYPDISALTFTINTTLNALPGIIILGFISWVIPRYYPPSGHAHG